jgi:PAS domain S-box-containing protein
LQIQFELLNVGAVNLYASYAAKLDSFGIENFVNSITIYKNHLNMIDHTEKNMADKKMYKSIFNSIIQFLFLSILTFLAMLTTCIADDNLNVSKGRLQTVTLQLKWKHQFQFAGYYAALEKGYYSEAGLDVKILEIKSGEESINKVIDGKADFGIAMSDLILHRANGQSVVALASIFQHSPLIILSPKASEIKNIHTLTGKRLGLEAHSAELIAYLENESISLEEIKLHPHDYSISNLISGKVDAISAYSTDEPFLLFNKGIEYNTFTPRSGGIDFYGDTLFTSEAQIKENPERVSAFLNASLKGWQYALENSEEIIDLILSKYTQRHSREHLLFEAQHSKTLIMPDVVQLGYMHSGRWNHIAKTYAKLGQIDKNFSLKGFMYVSESGAGYGRLKRTLLILLTICLLLGLGAMILFFFNRKFSKEINERKKTERLLITSESLFRGLYDNMTSGSAIYEVINDGSKGSDYIVKNFNKKSLKIEDQTLDQVVGKTLFDLRPNIDNYGLISAMKKVWETGEPDYFPIKIYQDERFSNYYENYIFRIPTGEVVTIYNDVTDHKNAEIALKKSEERFALAMEFAIHGLYDWNLETNEIYYSPVWKRMLGYEEDELPNDFSVWETLTNPKDVERSWKIQNELINKQRDRFEIEFKMQHKDGHWVDILSRANALFDENNKAVRIVGTHVDITERKKMEEQLQQSQKMESIGVLAGGIAHEFNNILSIIIGNNELVMEELPESGYARESSEEIRIAGLRARDVVKQLLTFSRQDKANKRPLDIGSVVEESMKLIRSSTPRNIDILQNIAEDVAPVLCNPTQINQVLINLCANAYSAMLNTGGVISIDLRNETIENKISSYPAKLKPGRYVKLIVSDTGHGMDKDTLDRIFEPYFTTKGIGEGSGIGLAVVHGIVEKHNGVILPKSQLNKGTTFTLLFPAHEGQLEEKEEKHLELPTGNENILLVDDETSILKLGMQRLESLGYSVQGTTDPLEALTMFKSNPDDFDLVITDMAMPNMTGDQLVSEIRKIRYDVPTMLCTGYSQKISKEKAYEIGISAFIMKPLDKTDFAVNVRKVLDEAKKKI